MTDLFREDHAFNADLSAWNAGQVTAMQKMFSGTPFLNEYAIISTENTSFNGDLSAWNVAMMSNLFLTLAQRFNGDLNAWNVGTMSNLLLAPSLAALAQRFNGDLSAWAMAGMALAWARA